MKKCSKCSQVKPLSEFYAEKKQSDGKRSQCKTCTNITNKKYHDKNKDKITEYHKKYYEENKTKLKNDRRDYYKNNKDKVNKQHTQYIRDRRRNDPEFRLLGNIRARLYKSLKGLTKSEASIQYIGCNLDTLKKHLESQFTEGMTWENYGKWHVDHIKPLASFDFTGAHKESQLKDAWHFTNLQPLWAKDNLIKGSKSPSPEKL